MLDAKTLVTKKDHSSRVQVDQIVPKVTSTHDMSHIHVLPAVELKSLSGKMGFCWNKNSRTLANCNSTAIIMPTLKSKKVALSSRNNNNNTKNVINENMVVTTTNTNKQKNDNETIITKHWHLQLSSSVLENLPTSLYVCMYLCVLACVFVCVCACVCFFLFFSFFLSVD